MFQTSEKVDLTLWEENNLMDIGKIFVLKREELTKDWRKLHNEKLHDFYSSLNITMVIKPRLMKWVISIYAHQCINTKINSCICNGTVSLTHVCIAPPLPVSIPVRKQLVGPRHHSGDVEGHLSLVDVCICSQCENPEISNIHLNTVLCKEKTRNILLTEITL